MGTAREARNPPPKVAMKLTLSKAALASNCVYWTRDDVQCLDVPGRAAIQGNALHAWCAAYHHGGKPQALYTKWFSERAAHLARWLDSHRDTPMLAEVAFAVDVTAGTARVLGLDIGRAYASHGALPHELCGSADLVAFDGSCATVYDVKSGQFVSDDVWAQMEALGLAAMLSLGAESARLVVLHARADGVAERERLMDREHVTGLLDVMDGWMDAENAWPTPGPWCSDNYCPARANCGTYQLTKARTA